MPLYKRPSPDIGHSGKRRCTVHGVCKAFQVMINYRFTRSVMVCLSPNLFDQDAIITSEEIVLGDMHHHCLAE